MLWVRHCVLSACTCRLVIRRKFASARMACCSVTSCGTPRQGIGLKKSYDGQRVQFNGLDLVLERGQKARLSPAA